MRLALVGLCILSVAFAVVSQAGRNAYICEVLFENFCPGQTQCPTDPVLTFGQSSYGFENFNVISFDSFTAGTGDIEGRAAIRNNLALPVPGYSFGFELITAGVGALDNPLPYSLVVGRDANWNSGSLHPDGSNLPHAGAKEYLFVGGTFTSTVNELISRKTGTCNTAGCLDADFDNAQAYYKLLSTSWAGVADNAQASVQYGMLSLHCNSLTDATHVVTITPNDFSTITSYSTPTNCNAQSAIVFNIQGAGSIVKFLGSYQTYFRKEKVLYNVVATVTAPSVRVEVEVRGNLLAPASQFNSPGGVFVGQVIVANVQMVIQINRNKCTPVAPPPNPTPSTNLCPSWETACAGLDITLNNGLYSFRDFNVISFNDFHAITGDIEGRLIVRNDATIGAGYSIGYELQTSTNQPDRSLPYSLVVGGDLDWVSGALFPFGNGIPYPGNREDLYVGGIFTTTQADFEPRRFGPGSIDQEFVDAQVCYNGYSATIGNAPDNVQFTIEWSGLSVICNSASATDYVISLTPAQIAQFTYTTLGNCNFQARWYINIRGTEDVEITGGSFPAIPGGIVYNVIGSRNIFVHDTLMGGHLLAPLANLNQSNGVIVGKVVAGNIEMSLQINKQNTCPQPTVVQIPSIVVEPATDSNTIKMINDAFIVGDVVQGYKVVATDGQGSVVLAGKVTVGAGQVIYVKDVAQSSRVPTAGSTDNSSASAVVLSLAVFALALLF